MVEFLVDCQDSESGGFRPVQGHDPHLLNTLSAVQVGYVQEDNIYSKKVIISIRWLLFILAWIKLTQMESYGKH